jgi:hypothetical protein
MDKNRYLIELSESERTQFGRVDFAHQNHEQQVFSAIWALESQVNNGGFAQYFESENHDTVSFAPTALRAIGAMTCADLVERALTCRALTEYLEKLDLEFYAYPDNLTDLLYAYVAARPKIFSGLQA